MTERPSSANAKTTMISVVMPAYNAERHIAEAIESILAQSHRDFELIILDDGSTDRTPDIIRAYAERDARIRPMTQQNAGVTATSNRAVEEAHYEWIARMDADDVALPNRLTKQVTAANQHPEVVAWGAAVCHISPTGAILSAFHSGPTSIDQFHQWRAEGKPVILYNPTALFRRSVVLEAGGYDTRIPKCEDAELWDRMADYGPIVALEEPLVLYRLHRDTESMRSFKQARMVMRYIRTRAERRAQGGGHLTFDGFREQCQHRSLLARLKHGSDDVSHYYYRTTGIRYGERRYLSAVASFAVATAANPRYALRRASQQLLAPTARRRMRAGAVSASDIHQHDPT